MRAMSGQGDMRYPHVFKTSPHSLEIRTARAAQHRAPFCPAPLTTAAPSTFPLVSSECAGLPGTLLKSPATSMGMSALCDGGGFWDVKGLALRGVKRGSVRAA